MESLMTRLRRMGRLLLLGILVVICAGLGIFYIDQNRSQRELLDEINRTSLTIARPLPSAEKLVEEYQEVNSALSPLTAKEVLNIIIGIAKDSGIDTSPEKEKLYVPPQEVIKEEKVGEGKYRVMYFNDIAVQGNFDAVLTFISKLESGQIIKTLILKKAVLTQVNTKAETGEEKTETVAVLNVAIYTKSGSTTSGSTK